MSEQDKANGNISDSPGDGEASTPADDNGTSPDAGTPQPATGKADAQPEDTREAAPAEEQAGPETAQAEAAGEAKEEAAAEEDTGNAGESAAKEIGFEDLGLSEKVLAAVRDAGYEKPTTIQREAIPHVLQRRDVLGLAQTGSGKTAAFVLPMLTLLEQGRPKARMPRTLILEPTRELAAQVYEAFQELGKYHRLKVALLIGGVSFEEQARIIDRGADVLIATPGRLLDHFERGGLLLTGVEILVIDEADRMLDMGFIPDIERIVKLVPFTRQTLFFSATMPKEIQRLVDQFLHLPVRVEAQRPSTIAETIDQKLVLAPADEAGKRRKLREVIDARKDSIKNAIIFANRKKTVADLLTYLLRHGYSAGALHGDMDQYQRLETLQKFRDGEISYLVASDVAARGLDIPAVSHVFNHDIPVSPEDYVHRIGRTGRAGRRGEAVSLVTREDFRALAAIQDLIGMKIPWEGEAPPEEEIEEALKAKKRRKKKRTRGKAEAEKAAKQPQKKKSSKDAEKGKRAESAPAAQAGGQEKRKKRRRRRRKRKASAAAQGTNSAVSAQNGSGQADSSAHNGSDNDRGGNTAGADSGKAAANAGSGEEQGTGKAAFDENSLPAFLARPVERE